MVNLWAACPSIVCMPLSPRSGRRPDVPAKSDRPAGVDMELWREMRELEHTNLSRDGSWLELVRRKTEA